MTRPGYRAFISYSHADEQWAVWLQRRLERYRAPAQEPDRHPLRPVFRDRSELAAGELTPAIEAALADSAALIVICSPASTASEWVAAEIRTFKALHEDPLILPMVVEGDGGAYTSVFPEPLTYRSDNPEDRIELLAADARPDKDGRADAFLKLAAALLETSFDALKRRTEVGRLRRLLAIAGGSIAVAAIAVILSVIALLARQDAEQRRDQAEELVTFMIGDDELTPAAVLQRGRALRQIADVRVARGQLDDALELYQLTFDTLDRVEIDNQITSDQLDYERALTYLASSTVYYMRGAVAPSREDMLHYRALIAVLAQRNPDNIEYLAQLATADNNLGALAMADGATDDASAQRQLARFP